MLRPLLLLVLLGCGAPGAGGATEPLVERCSCEQLNAPIQLPGDATTWTRWRNTAIEVDNLFAQLAAIIPEDGHCLPTLDADIARALADHVQAVRDTKELNDASCDHFARWQMERPEAEFLGEQMSRVTMAMRGCSISRSSGQLTDLLITRTCTVVSMR